MIAIPVRAGILPALFDTVEKVAERHFFEFYGFRLSHSRSRAAKPAKYETPWVFIRSDALVVRAGWNIRGCGP